MVNIKRFVMWCVCWGLFWVGDFVSKFQNIMWTPIACAVYPIYNWCMHHSSTISEKYNFDVWTKI